MQALRKVRLRRTPYSREIDSINYLIRLEQCLSLWGFLHNMQLELMALHLAFCAWQDCVAEVHCLKPNALLI